MDNLKSNVLGKCAERFSLPFSAEDLQGDLARTGASVPIKDIKAALGELEDDGYVKQWDDGRWEATAKTWDKFKNDPFLGM